MRPLRAAVCFSGRDPRDLCRKLVMLGIPSDAPLMILHIDGGLHDGKVVRKVATTIGEAAQGSGSQAGGGTLS